MTTEFTARVRHSICPTTDKAPAASPEWRARGDRWVGSGRTLARVSGPSEARSGTTTEAAEMVTTSSPNESRGTFAKFFVALGLACAPCVRKHPVDRDGTLSPEAPRGDLARESCSCCIAALYSSSMAVRSFPAGDEESESIFLPGYRNYL